jgi:arginine/lysine/ornithine decarboxylase
VTNGTSTSNRVVFMASVTQGDVALIDRNCHKSLVQSLTVTGAIPTYLVPSRNYLGIVGPIYPQRLTPQGVAAAVAGTPLAAQATAPQPVHAVVINSTYDGLCYRATRVAELLGQSVDRLHFDEAWFGYAPFNPLYAGRFGLAGGPEAAPADGPTVFTVTSTHKLLAALSQASYIHVRDGRRPVEHGRFNESFMMHASTSPSLPALAAAHPERYAGAGLRDLADEMFAHVQASRQLQLQAAAFSTLPVPATTPVDAYRRLVRGAVEAVPLAEMAGRVVATAVLPYPPGIPMLMPGERAGEAGGPYLGYLRAIEDFDGRFPGFAHETHGVQKLEGRAHIYCLAGGA